MLSNNKTTYIGTSVADSLILLVTLVLVLSNPSKNPCLDNCYILPYPKVSFVIK
jgi:hypothetical protein